eukprot:comp20120_c0_seq1/m.24833 comp20120_c0_seq1/g.24833  ORF comp20120_c0_seq1/g.24833 comp20120_c0_seq1/m.24833 type:complete len:978 (-) comp20120_c0_seq1:45-2978(-)
MTEQTKSMANNSSIRVTQVLKTPPLSPKQAYESPNLLHKLFDSPRVVVSSPELDSTSEEHETMTDSEQTPAAPILRRGGRTFNRPKPSRMAILRSKSEVKVRPTFREEGDTEEAIYLTTSDINLAHQERKLTQSLKPTRISNIAAPPMAVCSSTQATQARGDFHIVVQEQAQTQALQPPAGDYPPESSSQQNGSVSENTQANKIQVRGWPCGQNTSSSSRKVSFENEEERGLCGLGTRDEATWPTLNEETEQDLEEPLYLDAASVYNLAGENVRALMAPQREIANTSESSHMTQAEEGEEIYEEINLPESLKKRREYMKEFLENERIYLEDLHVLAVGYPIYLTQYGLVTEEEKRLLVGNTAELLAFHKSLSAYLSANFTSLRRICQCFLQNADNLERYIQYATNYPSASDLMNRLKNKPDFHARLQRIQGLLKKREGLESTLIKPLHRLRKFTNAFEGLRDTCRQAEEHDDEGCLDCREVKATLQLLERVRSEANGRTFLLSGLVELKRNIQGLQVEELEQYGALLHCGPLKMLNRKKQRASSEKGAVGEEIPFSSTYCYLFEKAFLQCKKKTDGTIHVRMQYSYPTGSCMFVNVPREAKPMFEIRSQTPGCVQETLYQVDSQKEKGVWEDCFRRIIATQATTQESLPTSPASGCWPASTTGKSHTLGRSGGNALAHTFSSSAGHLDSLKNIPLVNRAFSARTGQSEMSLSNSCDNVAVRPPPINTRSELDFLFELQLEVRALKAACEGGAGVDGLEKIAKLLQGRISEVSGTAPTQRPNRPLPDPLAPPPDIQVPPTTQSSVARRPPASAPPRPPLSAIFDWPNASDPASDQSQGSTTVPVPAVSQSNDAQTMWQFGASTAKSRPEGYLASANIVDGEVGGGESARALLLEDEEESVPLSRPPGLDDIIQMMLQNQAQERQATTSPPSPPPLSIPTETTTPTPPVAPRNKDLSGFKPVFRNSRSLSVPAHPSSQS